MAKAPSLADKAISFTDLIGGIAGAGQTVEKVRPVLHLLAQWAPIPYLAQIDNVLQIAEPYLDKIQAAVPIVRNAIDTSGRPVLDSVQTHGPELVDALKHLLAIARNNDPTAKDGTEPVRVADISNSEIARFAGVVFTPGSTNEEQEREWNRDGGAASS